MLKYFKKGIYSNIASFILPVLLLIIWQYITVNGYISSHILPKPNKILSTFLWLFTAERFVFDITFSLGRVMVGLVIGVLSGFFLGLLMGLSKTAEKIFAPFLHLVRQVPIIGWIPLIVMWFGLNETPRYLIIAIAAFFPAALNTFSGVRSVPRSYEELGAVYGFKGFNRIRRIILPAALPSIVTGISLSLAMSWELLVAAELLMATQFGVGRLILVGRDKFQMELVIVGIITVGFIGFLMTKIVEQFGKGTQGGNVFHQRF